MSKKLTPKEAYLKSKKKNDEKNELMGLLKTHNEYLKVVSKEDKPLYPRTGHYIGKYISHTKINDDITAVMYMNTKFIIKYVVMPTKIFNRFYRKKDRSDFFDIFYDIMGPDIDHDAYSSVEYYKKNDEPLWYHTQAFKEFVEVCVPNAEEKKRLYAIADSIKEVDC